MWRGPPRVASYRKMAPVEPVSRGAGRDCVRELQGGEPSLSMRARRFDGCVRRRLLITRQERGTLRPSKPVKSASPPLRIAVPQSEKGETWPGSRLGISYSTASETTDTATKTRRNDTTSICMYVCMYVGTSPLF